MNNTNETKMDMKQAKQNNTPNIRWTLVGYDLIVYALVAVILLVLYGGMDMSGTPTSSSKNYICKITFIG